MQATGPIAKAHRAAQDRAWAEVYEHLTQADADSGLDPEELGLLATSAYMLGREDAMIATLERAHQMHLESHEILKAARAGFWIGLDLALRGEIGPASGWFARTQRLVEQHGEECAETGYLMLPGLIQAAESGDDEGAMALGSEAIRIGQSFGEPDLVALAVHAQGRALMRQGRVPEGLRLLDEAMVAVMADRLSPLVTGIIYCSVIEGCHEVQAVQRAHEWTEALTGWCGQQPELVAFTGQCLTHRAELMQLRGEWAEAMVEAELASTRFHPGMNELPAAQAHYRMGELYRLRGEFDAAQAAYRSASAWGWSPQPGLALLRLAEGNVNGALAALRTAYGEATQRVDRARVLPALIEAQLAAGKVDEAAEASRELDEIAKIHHSTLLAALARESQGRVHLARHEHGEAAHALAKARSAWLELAAPYEAARARELLSRAYREVGDEESAQLELVAARESFRQLGAAPDLARLEEEQSSNQRPRGDGPLTKREVEVLRLVAAGKTNKAIAADLFVSDRTIDRHVSNILTKLGLPTRTAATSYALEHNLI